MRVCRLCRRNHFLVGGIRLAHADIIPHSSGGEPCLLQNHAEILAQTCPRHGSDIRAVHTDCTAVDIIKPHQQIDQRGFAASGRPDNCHTLPGSDRNIAVFDQRTLRHIGERNIVQQHRALCVRQPRQAGRLGAFLRRVDQREDTVCTGERVLQLGDNTGDFIERFGVLVCVAQER